MAAEAFHPGEFLRDELAARGLSGAQFAEQSGIHVNTIIEILSCERAINPRCAFDIGRALGTSAELWINLQASYETWMVHKVHKAKKTPTRSHGDER